MFDIPFEAKAIKVVPLTWHDTISVRLDIIGCTEVPMSTASEEIEIPEVVVEEEIPEVFQSRRRKIKTTTKSPIIMMTSTEVNKVRIFLIYIRYIFNILFIT